MDVPGEEIEQLREDKRPSAHVLRFLLTPDEFLGIDEGLCQAGDLFFVEGIELLERMIAAASVRLFSFRYLMRS